MTDHRLTLTTSSSHGLNVGDIVTWKIRLTIWRRFLIWVAQPWRWPSKFHTASAVVTYQVSSVSTEINWSVKLP